MKHTHTFYRRKTSKKIAKVSPSNNYFLFFLKKTFNHLTNNPQPTTHNPQPTTHNPQPTTHNQQPTTNNPQPTTHNQQPTTNTKTTPTHKNTRQQQRTTTHNNNAQQQQQLPSRLCVSFQVKPQRVTMAFVARDTGSSAAKRRRERRLRSWLRHERMTVAMALAEKLHHSAQRPEMAIAGVWGNELNCTATIRDPPPSPLLQNIVAHQNTASVTMSFTITFPITTSMKFGMTLQHVVSTR